MLGKCALAKRHGIGIIFEKAHAHEIDSLIERLALNQINRAVREITLGLFVRNGREAAAQRYHEMFFEFNVSFVARAVFLIGFSENGRCQREVYEQKNEHDE